MLSKSFFKRVRMGFERIYDDPWLFMGSAAVLVLLALLTVSASALREIEQRAEPRAEAFTTR